MNSIERKSSNNDIEIDSNNAFKYMHLFWRVIGIYPLSTQNPNIRFLYRSYTYLVIVFAFIFLPLTMLGQLFFIDNMKDLCANLSLSTTFAISTCKYLVIFAYRDTLLEVRDFLNKLDGRCSANAIDRQLIREAVRLCHRIFIAYFVSFTIAAYSLAFASYPKQQLMYGDWLSNIFMQSAIANFRITFGYQFAGLTYAIFQNVNNDGYAPCYLIVMIAQLRALNARIARIGVEPKMSTNRNFDELLACIQDHKLILRYFDCIRQPISRTLFVQFLIMALVLCLSAINFFFFDHDFLQSLFTVSYLFAVVTEVFPCCWLVNELMSESDLLTTAMYSCNWYEQDQRFKRTLIIFMQRSQITNVIRAGNLAPVTLQTFIAIVRFAFSMFTILSEMNV